MLKIKRITAAAVGVLLAVGLLAAPAMAQAATPETAVGAANSIPDLTPEEAAYDRVSPYDAADAAAMQTVLAAVEDGVGLLETYNAALGGYNTANADAAYQFLRGELGMNSAQACGVLASMYTESRFEPTACNQTDTNGQTSYGLLQWNGARYDSLRDWCAANGHDYTTLAGQLHYLQYEITNTWEKQIWTRTDSSGNCFGTVADTADGAYAAGYTWARYFGRGASAYWYSRGDYARDGFWPLYGGRGLVDEGAATIFVTRLYQVCLDRTPDPAGLQNWVNAICQGGMTGTAAASGFVFSEEFKAKNYCNTDYVKQLYRAFLGREYDGAGLADWVQRLTGGQTREAVFNGFALSGEFGAICAAGNIPQGSGMAVPTYGTVPTGPCSVCGEIDGVTAFVTRMYDVCLDRKPEAAGLADWTNRLWSHTASGRQVALGFIFSDEFKAKKYSNMDYVEYLYKAFLGRASDTAGKADWLARMANGWTREQVFDGFVGSDEFSGICSSYGIVRG